MSRRALDEVAEKSEEETTDRDIAKVYRYDELLDEMLENPKFYELLVRQQSL